MNCPKCEADVTDTYEPDDWSVGIVGGYYCDACDLGIDEDEYQPMEDAVDIGPPPRDPDKPLGTPISQLSGRPGEPGYEEFCRIAKSWGFD